jgi:hypothetical protein
VNEYDIFVPLHYSDGRPIDSAKLDRLKSALVERFGGLTNFPQANEGLWKLGGIVYRDKIVIYRVLADDDADSRAFLERLKQTLKADLDQEDILIIRRDVEAL